MFRIKVKSAGNSALLPSFSTQSRNISSRHPSGPELIRGSLSAPQNSRNIMENKYIRRGLATGRRKARRIPCGTRAPVLFFLSGTIRPGYFDQRAFYSKGVTSGSSQEPFTEYLTRVAFSISGLNNCSARRIAAPTPTPPTTAPATGRPEETSGITVTT